MSVPKWRIAAGVVVLVAIAVLGAVLAPVYLRNLSFQQYVANLAEQQDTSTRSDPSIQAQIVEKAADMQLPVHMDDVHITRSPDALRISVKYVVHVNLLLYTVDLHFYPGAGSR